MPHSAVRALWLASFTSAARTGGCLSISYCTSLPGPRSFRATSFTPLGICLSVGFVQARLKFAVRGPHPSCGSFLARPYATRDPAIHLVRWSLDYVFLLHVSDTHEVIYLCASLFADFSFPSGICPPWRPLPTSRGDLAPSLSSAWDRRIS